MKEWYSCSELLGLPGMPAHRTGISRKATREGWSSRSRNGKGGGQEYSVLSLPHQTQIALQEVDSEEQSSLPAPSNATAPQPSIKTEAHQIRVASSLDTKVLGGSIDQRADAWYLILRAYENWITEDTSDSALVRQEAFIQAYQGQSLKLPAQVYKYVPSFGRSTLLAQQKRRREAPSLRELGGKYGNRKGKGKIDSDSELQKAIRVCIAAGGEHWGPSHIYDILLEVFGYEVTDFSIGQLREYLRKFRKENPQEWNLLTDLGRAKNHTSPAFGSRSEGIYRPNQLWELDDTKSDVLLKYTCPLSGAVSLRRYILVGCIDVCTRRKKYLVSPTSKAEAICLLLRAAILDWGKPEGVKTDNHKAYLSVMVLRFLADLNIEAEDLRCLPGHPEQKPHIERSNHTLQRRDMPKNPLFVGHSVSDRQALRANPNWSETAIELAMEPDEFQDWLDVWCELDSQRPHGRPGIGLEGKTPLEVLELAVSEGWEKETFNDPRELDFLMMQAPTKDGLRKVGRQGIPLNGRLYVAKELGKWVGKKLHVRFNFRDPINIYVYTSANLTEFVCIAKWRKAEGVNLAEIAQQANALYAALEKEASEHYKLAKRLLKKLAKDPFSILGDTKKILVAVQSKLAEYPASEAIAKAIASLDTQEISPQISDEEYEAELRRLQAEQIEQTSHLQQEINSNQNLENLLETWQQGQKVAVVSSEVLEEVKKYLRTPEGKGYLTAVTGTVEEEQQFQKWLAGEDVQKIVVDPDRLLLSTFRSWKNNQEVSLEDRKFVANYISFSAGRGALDAIISQTTDLDERSQFTAWLHEFQN